MSATLVLGLSLGVPVHALVAGLASAGWRVAASLLVLPAELITVLTPPILPVIPWYLVLVSGLATAPFASVALCRAWLAATDLPEEGGAIPSAAAIMQRCGAEVRARWTAVGAYAPLIVMVGALALYGRLDLRLSSLVTSGLAIGLLAAALGRLGAAARLWQDNRLVRQAAARLRRRLRAKEAAVRAEALGDMILQRELSALEERILQEILDEEVRMFAARSAASRRLLAHVQARLAGIDELTELTREERRAVRERLDRYARTMIRLSCVLRS
ncbi:MAG: hypothetical protein HYV63_28640 [Candidatus Schekmanbacteria bacterium]|nr:hypothetical protein [Candidatus Schekmanbacteria bacterium]